ncbi:MAG TPA: polynucleotide adenylyltransferase PcnB [Candidatus Binataceae bacterium]
MEPRILERNAHPISRRDVDPNVLKVLYRLVNSGHVAYLVGGGVRDLMLSRRPKDFDIATSAHPQQVRELFRNSRLIGRRFRLVHVFFGPQNIEVATFRKRSEEVAAEDDPLIRLDNTFGTPEEDAFRRDFTVNALFYDPQTFRVIDYPTGVDDLNARLIRTIGDPEVRVREDPVRMMRAVRFAAKLNFQVEPATRAAIERHRADLLKASVPRLVEETFRTLGQPEAARAIVLMKELGLLDQLLPFLAEHLERNAAIPGDSAAVRDSATVRNMAALGRSIAPGTQPAHETMLAALFLDFCRDDGDGAGSGKTDRFDLLDELRARGFARGDTEHMRLLVEAFGHLAVPSRRTRRLARRPYFAQAQRFFDLMAPTYGLDGSALARFLAEPQAHGAHPHPPHSPNSTQAGGASPARHKRRRRRRGGAAPADARPGIAEGANAPSAMQQAVAPDPRGAADRDAGATDASGPRHRE